MKLYNAGSFFDPRAVPDADYDAVAEALAGSARVIVESHPALVGPRVDRLARRARRASQRPARPSPHARSGDGARDGASGARSNASTSGSRSTSSRAPPARCSDAAWRCACSCSISPPFVPAARAGRLAAALGRRRVRLRRLGRLADADAGRATARWRRWRRRCVPVARRSTTSSAASTLALTRAQGRGPRVRGSLGSRALRRLPALPRARGASVCTR